MTLPVSLLIITFLFLSGPHHASAEEIVIIKSQSLPIYQQAIDGFRGVYEGTVREFDLKGDLRESEKVISSLKKRPFNLILAIGLLAARVAKENFDNVPIVFCMVFDPERFGLTGENISGITLQVSLTHVFSQMKKLLPNVTTIGVLYDPLKTRPLIDQAKHVTESLDLDLFTFAVKSQKDLPKIARTIPDKVDLLWLIPDSTVLTPESVDFILLTSFVNNLPIVTFSEDLVRKGALAALSADYKGVGEQAGNMVLNIMKNENGAPGSIRPAEKIRLTINMKTAKKMGVVLDSDAVRSADKVYD